MSQRLANAYGAHAPAGAPAGAQPPHGPAPAPSLVASQAALLKRRCQLQKQLLALDRAAGRLEDTDEAKTEEPGAWTAAAGARGLPAPPLGRALPHERLAAPSRQTLSSESALASASPRLRARHARAVSEARDLERTHGSLFTLYTFVLERFETLLDYIETNLSGVRKIVKKFDRHVVATACGGQETHNFSVQTELRELFGLPVAPGGGVADPAGAGAVAGSASATGAGGTGPGGSTNFVGRAVAIALGRHVQELFVAVHHVSDTGGIHLF